MNSMWRNPKLLVIQPFKPPNLSAPRPLYYRGIGCIPASTVFQDIVTLSELHETNRLHSWPEKLEQESEFSPIPNITEVSLPRVWRHQTNLLQRRYRKVVNK
ncbi:unnamed protein product [Ixodes pacificus]